MGEAYLRPATEAIIRVQRLAIRPPSHDAAFVRVASTIKNVVVLFDKGGVASNYAVTQGQPSVNYRILGR